MTQVEKVKLNSLYGKFVKINKPYEPSNLYSFIMKKGIIKNGVKYIDTDSIK